jgi:bacillopeptidase F
MLKYQKARRIISLVVSIFMVMGCFATNAFGVNNVYAGQINPLKDGTNLIQAKESLFEDAMKKIESVVMDDLKTEDLVEVMVYMKAKADTGMVATETRELLSAKASTPYQTKLQVRRNVVAALDDMAQTSQANLIKYLQAETEKGNVEDFQSYSIVNMVYVKATKEVVENIAYMTEVAKIYKNKTHTLESFKTDENAPAAGEGVEWNVLKTRADEVWALGYDGTGAVVGSLDSGVDWTHPALKNKWRGYDPITGATNAEGNWFDPVYNASLPADSDEHGTHVMGTMVGQEPNGANKVGVAPGAKWITARVFNTSGSTTDAILLAAADWMKAPGGNPDNAPDVVNNSWGGGSGIDDWYRDAVIAWRNAEIVPVFSAGNQRAGEPAPGPGSISCPANYPESFAVAAVDRNDILASFSKLGPSPYDTSLIKPNISAGGVSVRSSIPGGGYDGTFSGTSMSAPAVSGTVALIASANQALTVDEIEELIMSTARPLTDSKFPNAPNMGYGYGFVDAFEAVSQIASGTGYISGRVLVPGEDGAVASIVHEQNIFETFAGSDIEISAQITDDVAVTETELLVKQEGKSYWIVVPMNRISGDHKDGVYKATISADMILGESVTYKIKARDYVGEVVVTPDYMVEVKFGIIPGEYTQGFEENANGWIFDGIWEYGTPTGVGPSAYEGEKLATTTLNGNYPNNDESWMITPPIDLRDASLETASLRFHEWYNMEANYDKGYLLVTSNYGETWTEIRPVITGIKEVWKEAFINLNDYIGSGNPVFVAFRFTSDVSGQRAGWYIDNVRLMARDNDVPAIPTGLTINISQRGIKLDWNISSEADISHYNIYRSEISGEAYTKIAESNANNFINDQIVAGTSYYYTLSAEDFSGNESGLTEEVTATAPSFSIVFGSNFEDDNGGFVSSGTNNSWGWGVPTSGPNAATSGTKLWATNLSGNYPASSDCHITSPSIAMPVTGSAILAFSHWIDMEGTSTLYDYGQVQISTDDGATWTNITPVTGGKYGKRLQTWQNVEITLAAYAGQTVKIRFFFHSDSSSSYAGWYVDDVYVVNNITSVPTQAHEIVEVSDKMVEETKKKDYIEPAAPDYRITAVEAGTYQTIEDSEVQKMQSIFVGIPVADAVVTVLETGKSVKVDPATGKFSMRVPMGTYTLIAEAYGYYSLEKVATVLEDQTTKANFVLEPKPQGTIVGTVFDRYYETPAAFAVIRIAEDPRIAPVIADANGNFTINGVYEGEYTLKVRADGFESGEARVTVVGDETTVVEIGLKRFVGYEDEIVYDDGTGENALVLNAAGNGLAVRFTPSQYGKVKGANVFFWDNSWPTPGGNRIGFAIYGVDANGQPYQVGAPIFQNILRGEWNTIDLSSFGFATDEDFYISTIQEGAGTECPGVGIDETSEHGNRSYMNVAGAFNLISTEEIDGALMIRARMEYAMDVPVITNLPELSYTNQDIITVEGRLTADGKANVYVNGDKITSVDSVNRVFSVQLNLPADENTIIVSAELNGVETEPSAPVVVIKDKQAPVLTITNPIDNAKVNVELIHVIGNATDNIELEKLEINDNIVVLADDGSFDEKVILNQGENIITVKATDLAGNVVTVVRTVIAELGTPVITNMLPNEDVTLHQEDTLTVSFNAPTGGQGYFRVLMPFGLQSDSLGIPMTEVDGLFTGTWEVPQGLVATGLRIQFVYVSAFGTKVTMMAEGRVTVIGNIENLAANSIIIDNESFDIEFLNNNVYAQSKLIEWYNAGGTIYIKINDTDLVTHQGKQVSIEKLPDFLTHFDTNGDITYYEKQ